MGSDVLLRAIVPVGGFLGAVAAVTVLYLPELLWGYSYPASLVAMAAASLVLYLGFKRSGWL